MAPAVTGPIAGTPGSGETRWHLQAKSLSETVAQLSRIWGGLAKQALAGEGEGELSRSVLEDPRLAPRADEAGELRVRTRTSVLTLVVVAPTLETQQRALAVVGALKSQHPSRAIILAPIDPDGPSRFDANIYAACQVPQRTTSEVCTEEILLRVGGELAQHLSSTVAPLLIHDLPVVLWWPDDVPFESGVLRELVASTDRLLVDSSNFRGTGIERLVGMGRTLRAGVVVHDIAWMRLVQWRELLAGLFDHPLLQPELRSITGLRIDIAKPGSVVRLNRAALFAGWIAAMLDWTIAAPLAEAPDGHHHGLLRSGKRDIPIIVRPISAPAGGSMRSAGSLVRAELEAGRQRSQLRVRVTRQSDHLLGTADWNGAQVARRAARLEPFDEVPFLAEALDRSGHDKVFERVLDRAIRITVPDAEAELGRPARRRSVPRTAARPSRARSSRVQRTEGERTGPKGGGGGGRPGSTR
jgi:glucose-6-phosphate dehydrogenase assembly protein OpcA